MIGGFWFFKVAIVLSAPAFEKRLSAQPEE
jgi:hypothetical protein